MLNTEQGKLVGNIIEYRLKFSGNNMDEHDSCLFLYSTHGPGFGASNTEAAMQN